MTDSQAPAALSVPEAPAAKGGAAVPAGATNPVAPAPAGARTAADVVTPEVVARLTRGVVGSGRTANHTPFTGERLAELPESTPEDVAEAFTRARAAQAAWAATPVRARAAVLLRFHDLVLQRQSEVLDLIQLETGKARLHAHEEVQAVCVAARHYGRKAASYLRAKRHTGVVPTLTKVTELRQPRGVVGQIAPWNYPLELSVGDALPAFVSGNAVVMKPDTETALTALWARDPLVTVTEDSRGGYAAQTLPTDNRRKGKGPDLPRPPRGDRGRHVRHADPAAPDEGRRPAAPDLAAARRAHPYQLRGPGRRADHQPALPQEARQGEGRLHPGRRHHLLDPPRREHPHRAGPVRQGLQLHGRHDRPPGALRGPPGAQLVPQHAEAPDARRPRALQPALVGADHHRSGHAVPGQLPDDLPQARRDRKGPAHGPAGARGAEPGPDPGGHQGRDPPRRGDQRLRRLQHRRADGHPAHRPLPGRLPDRRRRRVRRHRPVPPALRAPRDLRRGRGGRLRQPRRQPVPDDHGSGGAGDVVLAEQGRGGPAAAAGGGVRAGGR
ncbi:aldehyde dehydrogenase family protein [Streptomyces narbonensis]